MPKLDLEQAMWADRQAKMRELVRFEGWDAYLDLLDLEEEDAIDRMLAGDAGSFNYWQGYVFGLRKARSIPSDLAQRPQ